MTTSIGRTFVVSGVAGLSILGLALPSLGAPPPTAGQDRATAIGDRPAAQNQGYLGFSFAYQESSGGEGGFRILRVVAKGPAALAGLLEGDVVTKIDGLAFRFPDWERNPVNPFKWVEPGTELHLTVAREQKTIPIQAVPRPFPMGDIEADMKRQAKLAWGDRTFDRLAAMGVDIGVERRKDGKLVVEAKGVDAFDLEALATTLDGRIGQVFRLKLAPGQSQRLRLDLDPQGRPRLLPLSSPNP